MFCGLPVNDVRDGRITEDDAAWQVSHILNECVWMEVRGGLYISTEDDIYGPDDDVASFIAEMETLWRDWELEERLRIQYDDDEQQAYFIPVNLRRFSWDDGFYHA